MILYFFNRYWSCLGKASANLPKGLYYSNDKQVDDVESGTSTFEFYLEFDEATRKLSKSYADESCYIVAKDEDEETRIWQIIDDESDEEAMTRYFNCEDAGMDLINETLPAWTAPSTAQKVDYYINKAIYDSGFEIGNNEIPNLTRTLDWEGEATALERLQSILTQFDNSEFRFRFDVDENTLELKHKYIDIYQKVGSETGIQLRYGREVKNIKMKRSKANLYNAYRCYGATKDNKQVTLTGYTLSDSQKEINAETGKARFVLSGNTLMDMESNAKYSRYLNPYEQGEDLGLYSGIYTGTAQTQKGLADEVIRKLKLTSDIEVNFDVELLDAPRSLKIGDYVYIVNDADELYLEGRILQLTRSRANDTFEITLGDYLMKESGIDVDLQAMADKVASLKDGISPIITVNPDTTLTIVDAEGTKTTDVLKGDDGKTSYLHIAYANSADGKTGFSVTDSTNKLYIGQYTDFTSADSTDPTKYAWTKTKGETGAKGDPTGITVSTTVPTSPYTGMLWKHTGSVSGYIKDTTYRWNGSKWEIYTFSVENLIAATLSAITANLGNITAGTVTNPFTNIPLVNNSGSKATGTSTLANGNLNSTGFVDGTFPIQTQYSPVGLDQVVLNTDGSVRTRQQLYQGVLTLRDSSGNQGSLEAKNLASVPWTNIPLATGAIVSEGNTPQYRKIANLDGSYTIELRGQVGFSAGKAQSATLGTLPTGNRPSANHMYQQPCNHYYGARIAVLTSGDLQFRANYDTVYVALTGIRFTI